MTLEEMFCDLYDKYGKDFNWYLLPLTQADGAFVVELNKEMLAPGGISHSGPGGNRQFWPDENS